MPATQPNKVLWNQTPEELTFDTGAVRLRFHIGRMLTLREFSGSGFGNLAADLGGIGDLWKVAFRGPDGTAPDYPTLWGEFLGAEFREAGNAAEVTLRWEIKLSRRGGAEVQVRIAGQAGSSRLVWGLKVLVPDGWKVTGAEFPILPGLRTEELPLAAVPTGWGVEYDLAEGLRYIGQYPSWEAVMQMAALYGKGRGLYFAAHDPRARLKNFCLEAQGGTARLSILHHLTIPEETGVDFELPFPVITQFFEGDYTDAARLYRPFTFETPWGNTPPISQRSIPQWMKDTDLWLRPDGAPKDNVEITKKALEYFGDNVTCHWYRWHEIAYDTDYPEYFPALPGFAEAVAELHEAGTHVIPYINARLWDPDSKSWSEKEAWRAAARQENGDCYTEIYGSKVPNTAMCPATPLWQNEVASIVDGILKEYGTAGVYVDQVCCARGVPCFNPDHGHPVGGGDVWYEGYRELMDKVRERVPEGRVLTTEECAEPWIDQFDAFIILNTPMGLKSIPLFAAVYSDRIIGYCFLYFTKDEPENWLSFRVKNSRAYVYGAQVGWVQPYIILAPEAATEAEVLRDLARTRSHARPFVNDGQFLRLLEIAGDNPVLKGVGHGGFGADYPIEEPAVIGSAWLADGKLGVLLSNISNEDRNVKVNLPLKDAGIDTSATLEACIYGPEGEIERKKTGSVLSLTVPARKALTVAFEQA